MNSFVFYYLAMKSIEWSDAFTQSNNQSAFSIYAISKGFQILSSLKLKRDLLGSQLGKFI